MLPGAATGDLLRNESCAGDKHLEHQVIDEFFIALETGRASHRPSIQLILSAIQNLTNDWLDI